MVFEYLKDFKWLRMTLSAMATFALVEALLIEFFLPVIAIEFDVLSPQWTGVFIFAGALYTAVWIGEVYDSSYEHDSNDLPPSVVGALVGVICALAALFLTVGLIYVIRVITLIIENIAAFISSLAY